MFAIAIAYVDPDDWIIAGKSLSEYHLGIFYFYFDIDIARVMRSGRSLVAVEA